MAGGRAGRRGGVGAAPARGVVVVAAGVRGEDAPGVGGRPLDLLAHVAVVRGALVVAPASETCRSGHSVQHRHTGHKLTMAVGDPEMQVLTSAGGCP